MFANLQAILQTGSVFTKLCSCSRNVNYAKKHERFDVTSKVGDHVKIDEASPFFLVNLCQHQNKKNVMSTIMKTMVFSSFAKY